MMRLAAIEGELECLDHMTKDIKIDSAVTWREKPVADWLIRWITTRCEPLVGWLDPAERLTRSLFRWQVGPW